MRIRIVKFLIKLIYYIITKLIYYSMANVSFTLEQAREVTEWVHRHWEDVHETIRYASDVDRPEAACFAILAYPNRLSKLPPNYADKEKMMNTEEACDYYINGATKCKLKGVQWNGRVRCPYHDTYAFDLVEMTLTKVHPRDKESIEVIQVSADDVFNEFQSRLIYRKAT